MSKFIQEETKRKNAVFWNVAPCTSQKTAFFVVTAVKTTNPTNKEEIKLWEVLISIQFRIFCIPICCWNTRGLNIGKTVVVFAV
jgi:hypothetical protein